MVPHVHQDGIRIADEVIEGPGVQMRPRLGDVEFRVFDPVGDDFGPHLDLEFQEGIVVLFDGDVQPDALQEGDAVEMRAEFFQPVRGQGELGIDALRGDINPAQYAEGRPFRG
jgi:hypothetical protein